ncbi:MAG: serine hydroxymethyltransferase [Acidimicrobiales bacterium]
MPWPTTRDDALFSMIDREVDRQNTTLQLIASENFASPAVMSATGSVLTNKYSEGYPGKRYYGGNQIIDEVEELARTRATALFGAEHANVQPHSGANANVAVYLALLKPGDKVLGMSLDHGGHLTHGSPVNFSGLTYDFVAYGVSKSDERIDFDNVREIAKRERPRLIIAGATAYSRTIDPAPLRSIADEVGALLMFDAAHIAGLIAGGAHPNPVPFCDIVTFTTHKTLRGPRGGCILSRKEHAAAIDRAVFPGFQGGPLENSIAAKAVAFHEASRPEFATYARSIVTNAAALAQGLAGEGFRLVSGGTDNHLMLVDLRNFDAELTGKEAQAACDRAGISLNKNTIPDDPRSPFVTSGVRIGSPAVTTQGMGAAEMGQVATLIARALRGRADDGAIARVRADVRTLCNDFVPYPR